MATYLESEIWPDDLQRAIGQIVLISASFDHLAEVFTKSCGLSGARLRDALGKCSEEDLQCLGVDYYELYEKRNDLIHGFCVMPGGMTLRSKRSLNGDRGSRKVSYSAHEIDALVNGFSDLLQRVIQAQDQHPKYTTIKETPTP